MHSQTTYFRFSLLLSGTITLIFVFLYLGGYGFTGLIDEDILL
jgi:hypothetical protein